MFVRRHPSALQRRDRSAQAGDERRGREALLERGCVHERLEGRPGLPLRLRRAIEVAAIEIAAANHRAHLASQRIHGDERALQRFGGFRRAAAAAFRLPLLDVGDRARDLPLRRLLHVEIDRRVDLEPALVHAVPSEALHELLADFFLEILAEGFLGPQRVGELGPASHRAVVRRAIDGAGVAHRLQHHVAARDRAVEADGRRVGRWRFHETGEQRRLGHVQILRVFFRIASLEFKFSLVLRV